MRVSWRAHGRRCLVPRTATAASADQPREAVLARVDELIQRGRKQGHLSLPELRKAFRKAGISAADGRGILRELTDAGVRLGNQTDIPAAKGGQTAKDDMDTAKTTGP